jgi:hypothetical protein
LVKIFLGASVNVSILVNNPQTNSLYHSKVTFLFSYSTHLLYTSIRYLNGTLKNTVGLIVLAAILATPVLAVISNFNFTFAKNNDIRFEISECPVQKTSTTEKSGPCPDLGADNKIAESESKVDKSSETSPVHSASPTGFETIDPFGSTIK